MEVIYHDSSLNRRRMNITLVFMRISTQNNEYPERIKTLDKEVYKASKSEK